MSDEDDREWHQSEWHHEQLTHVVRRGEPVVSVPVGSYQDGLLGLTAISIPALIEAVRRHQASMTGTEASPNWPTKELVRDLFVRWASLHANELVEAVWSEAIADQRTVGDAKVRDEQRIADRAVRELAQSDPADIVALARGRDVMMRGGAYMALLSTLAKPVSAVLDDSRPRLRRQTLAMAADPIQPDNRKGTREPSFGEYLASAVVLGDAAAIRAISDWMSQNTAGGDIREDWPTMMALVTQARAAIKPLVEDLASAGREAADEAWALHADSQIAKRLEAAGLARDARAGAGWATLAFKLVAKERGKKSWKTLEKEWKRRDSRRGTRSRSN